jgi:predicted nicotinamide N-methyase
MSEEELVKRVDAFKSHRNHAKRRRDAEVMAARQSLIKKQRTQILEQMDQIKDNPDKNLVVLVSDVCYDTQTWFMKQGAQFEPTFGADDGESFSYWTINFE